MRNCKNLKENIVEKDDFKIFINFIEKLQEEDIFSIKLSKSYNMEKVIVDGEELVSLRASKKYRVYGIFIGNVFKIVKLDKNHKDT